MTTAEAERIVRAHFPKAVVRWEGIGAFATCVVRASRSLYAVALSSHFSRRSDAFKDAAIRLSDHG